MLHVPQSFSAFQYNTTVKRTKTVILTTIRFSAFQYNTTVKLFINS